MSAPQPDSPTSPPRDTRRTWWRRPTVWVPGLLVAAGAVGVALVVFAPWKLFVDDVVDEALPVVAPVSSAPVSSAPLAPPAPVVSSPAATSGSASAIPAVTTAAPETSGPPATINAPSSAPSPSAPTPSATAPTTPRVVAQGTFISHEHATTGRVRILSLADGRRVLRLENLDTSNGPDLKVWLTDQPVIDGIDGWGVFDDGAYLDLGSLKGNVGNQNYEIPSGAVLDGLTSVTIWCDRFNVSFGAATLTGA